MATFLHDTTDDADSDDDTITLLQNPDFIIFKKATDDLIRNDIGPIRLVRLHWLSARIHDYMRIIQIIIV